MFESEGKAEVVLQAKTQIIVMSTSCKCKIKF